MSTSHLPARALVAACGALAITATPTEAFPVPGAALTPLPVSITSPAPVGSALTPEGLERLIADARRGMEKQRRALEAAGPARRLRMSKHGRAVVPAGAPTAIRRLIRAGNRIAQKPYVWGGGHGSWVAPGYDCSGSVGYVLHAAGVLDTAVTSGALAAYGKSGRGKWVTIYANGGHTYMVVAGLRFDTTAFKQTGSRWTPDTRDHGGYTDRHPAGL
jgi:hypothetical protein